MRRAADHNRIVLAEPIKVPSMIPGRTAVIPAGSVLYAGVKQKPTKAHPKGYYVVPEGALIVSAEKVRRPIPAKRPAPDPDPPPKEKYPWGAWAHGDGWRCRLRHFTRTPEETHDD